ncbi:hypothetical protein QQF64_033482 [Cirrhinus molitorella]|uniref:Uncharacterized protein n=1 Tax=Cirrhinus molitorella TaxID=172907 RepID=A0ABR3MU16_9TELE
MQSKDAVCVIALEWHMSSVVWSPRLSISASVSVVVSQPGNGALYGPINCRITTPSGAGITDGPSCSDYSPHTHTQRCSLHREIQVAPMLIKLLGIQ